MQKNKSETQGAQYPATATGPAIPANETINGAENPATPAYAAPASNAGTNAQRSEAASPTPPAAQRTTAVQPLNGRMPVAQLRVHEDNERIYGTKEKDADLEKSIGKYGILDPLLITKDGRVISGHRRLRVATRLGISEVPVRVFESTDELEIKAALLEHNRHRIKTNVQLAAEAKLLMEIRKGFAARTNKDSGAKAKVANLPPAKKGKTRDAVGKDVGISARSVDKGVKVTGAIEMLRADGKEAEASKLEAALNKGFDTGHKAAVEMGVVPKAAPKKAKKAKIASTDAENITPPPATGASASGPFPAPEPSKAAPGEVDFDVALERADQIITFLRSPAAKTMGPQQKRDLGKSLDQINTCRADLSL